MMHYRFIVSRPRSTTTIPTVHLMSCQHAHKIKNPVKVFDADGDNAMAALDIWQRGRHSIRDLAAVAEPGKCCLGEWGRGIL